MNWRVLYNAPVSKHTICFTDDKSDNVILFLMNRNIAHAWNLGETSPENVEDYADDMEFGSDVPHVSLGLSMCGRPDHLEPQVKAFLEEMDSEPEASERLIHTIRRAKKDPEIIIAFMMALGQKSMIEEYLKFEKWFFKKYPQHPFTLIKQAENAASEKKWAEAISTLEGIDRGKLFDRWHCHICHILGIACLAMNEPEKAAAFLEEGMALDGGDCELGEILRLSHIGMQESDPPYTWIIFKEVDDLLSDRDWTGTIRFIEQHGLVHVDNIQLMARLARAWLNVEAEEGTPAWLCRIMSLAHFCQLYKSDFRSPAIILPGFLHVLTEDELRELVEEAELILNR